LKSSLREVERPSGAAPLIPENLDAIVVLLRHGETQFIVERRFQGQMEAPLTALGVWQAEQAGRRLAAPASPPPLPIPDTPPFAIVHSPLSRAAETAARVEAAMQAAGRAVPPLRADAGFAEVAQGAWEGLLDREIEERFGETLAGWRRWPGRFQAPGGENLVQVRERVDVALSRLLSDMADGSPMGTMDRHQVLGYVDAPKQPPRWSLVVAHGGVFRVVVCALLGLPNEHFWNFDFGLAGITVIEIRAGRAVVRAANLEGHLGDDAGMIDS
jgi:broad specificity phosphatase PhoE